MRLEENRLLSMTHAKQKSHDPIGWRRRLNQEIVTQGKWSGFGGGPRYVGPSMVGASSLWRPTRCFEVGAKHYPSANLTRFSYQVGDLPYLGNQSFPIYIIKNMSF